VGFAVVDLHESKRSSSHWIEDAAAGHRGKTGLMDKTATA